MPKASHCSCGLEEALLCCNCWVCAHTTLPRGACCAAAIAACACLCHHHYCLMCYAGAVLPLLMSKETPDDCIKHSKRALE